MLVEVLKYTKILITAWYIKKELTGSFDVSFRDWGTSPCAVDRPNSFPCLWWEAKILKSEHITLTCTQQLHPTTIAGCFYLSFLRWNFVNNHVDSSDNFNDLIALHTQFFSKNMAIYILTCIINQLQLLISTKWNAIKSLNFTLP